MPKDGENNEARLPLSPRDESVSSSLGESVMSESDMPQVGRAGHDVQGRELPFTFSLLINRSQVSLRMRRIYESEQKKTVT